VADVNIGTLTATLRMETMGFGAATQAAQQRIQELRAQIAALQPTLSALPFTAIENAIQSFSRASLAAGNSQQALRQAIAQGEQALRQFQVTTNASGQMVDRFGAQLSSTASEQLRGFAAGIREAQGELRTLQQFGINTGGSLSSSLGGLGAIGQRLLGVAGALGIVTSIEGAVQAMHSLATSIVEVGTRMEGVRLGFAALFGGQQAGARNFEQLTTFANRFGLELTSLTETYRRFSSATRGTALEGDRGQNVFESFMLAGRASGSTQAQLHQLGTAIEQMVSKGTVSMEELRRQMGNALPGAFQIAARAMGVTTDELDKMIRKGHTEAIPFLEAMARQLKTEFGPAAEAAAGSAQAAFNRLGNEILLLKDALANSGLIQWLGQLNNSLADMLKSLREVREERQRDLGGPAPVVPPSLQQSPEIMTRQREIEALRASLSPRFEAGDPDLSAGFARMGMTVEQTLARIKALQAEQQKIIANNAKMLESEQDVDYAAANPMRGVPDRLRKLFEEGQKALKNIDLDAQFLPALDIADLKLKSWEKTVKSIREEFDKLGPGIRQGLQPGMRTSPYDEQITRLAGERGIDPSVAKALVEQESGYDPRARSKAGAMGLLQLMPGTAARYGAGETPYDPETNLRAGLSYLADLLKQFSGDMNKALTAYNAGPSHGGIPLRTGENSTFAEDVLRRIPRGPLDVVQQAERMQEALRVGKDEQTPDREAMARVHATGREDIRRIEERAREAAADAKTYQDAIDTVTMTLARHEEQALGTLARLQAAYTQTKEARDEDAAAALKAQFAGNAAITTAADTVMQLAQTRSAYKEEVEVLKDRFIALKQNADAQRALEQRMTAFDERVLESLMGQTRPRDESPAMALRRQGEREGIPLTPGRDQQLQQVDAAWRHQQRLNEAVQIFETFGQSVGQSWTNALLSIADHTKTVGQAFREMARSILQSIIQITSQEAWKSLIHLGVGLLTSAIGGAVSGGVGPSGYGADLSGSGMNLATTFAAQGGAIVNKPTTILAGENSSVNPEYVVNHPQMQALLASAVRAAPTAGGQAAGAGIVIMNFPSQAAAEQSAADQRALGKQVILNEVLNDLGRGEASKISRVLRMTQR